MQLIKANFFPRYFSYRNSMLRKDNPMKSEQHSSDINFLFWGVIALVMTFFSPAAMASQFAYVLNNTGIISTFSIDPNNGKLTLAGSPTATGAGNIAINSSHTFAYLLIGPSISTYAINQSTGTLTPSGLPVSISLKGGFNNTYESVTNITIDPRGKFIYVAKMYHDSSTGGDVTIDTFAINQSTGTPIFTSTTYLVNYSGSVQGFSFDPTGAYLYLTHPTYGKVFVLAIDQLTGTPTVVQQFGDPAYKISIHPSGKFAYTSGGQVSINSVDTITGNLTYLRGIYNGDFFSPIAIDPSGNFVYVVDEAQNSIYIFQVDQTTGNLTPVGTPVMAGISPRQIYIDKFGRFAYVTNAGSNNVYVYSLHPTTGAMTLVQAVSSSLSSPTMLVGFSDATKPPLIITDFNIPGTSSSLTVGVTTFAVSDNTDVSAYCLSETNNDATCSWTTAKPSSYVFSTAGNNTLYAFARDVAGHPTNSASASVSITLPDTTAPAITAFSIPATSTSLTVPITTLTATDNIGVSGYCLSEINNSTGCTWNAAKPASFVFTTIGIKNIYAFAKDSAGNVSTSALATTTILDAAPPSVISFVIPATANNLTVGITTFTATDAVGVTGYCLSETNSSNSCTWSGTKPINYSFPTDGNKNLYAFAKDATGNISASVYATVSIDITLPVVSAGINQTRGAQFTQVGTASDGSIMTYAWSKQTGSGTITFGSPSALATTISASVNGTYTIRLSATDAVGNSAFSDMTLIWDTTLPPTLPDGDLNNDGTVNVADALRALQISVGLITQTATDLAKGDVAPLVANKPASDGKINTGDAVVILQKIVGDVSW